MVLEYKLKNESIEIKWLSTVNIILVHWYEIQFI